jgi:hypothetical protein
LESFAKTFLPELLPSLFTGNLARLYDFGFLWQDIILIEPNHLRGTDEYDCDQAQSIYKSIKLERVSEVMSDADSRLIV